MKHLLAVCVAGLLWIPSTSFAAKVKTTKKKAHLSHAAKIVKAKSPRVASATPKPAEPEQPAAPAAPSHVEGEGESAPGESDGPRRPVIPAAQRASAD